MTMDRQRTTLASNRRPAAATDAFQAWEEHVAQLFADAAQELLPESPQRALRVLDIVRERVAQRGYGSTPAHLLSA